MVKGINKLLFFFFELLLLVYFYRTAVFWMNAMTYDEAVADTWRFYVLFALELMMVALVFFNGGIAIRGVHLTCFLWVFFISFALLLSHNPLKNYFYCIAWPLLFEATFVLVRDKAERATNLGRLYVLVAVLGLSLFIQSMLYGGFEIQSNIVYFFILATPLLLIKENKVWRVVVLVLATVMALMSMKRSVMLAIALFWFIWGSISMLKVGRNKFLVLILGVALAAIAYYSYRFVDQLSGGFFYERFLLEDVSNGREDIYSITWDLQKDSTPVEWLFGHGHDAVRRDTQWLSAHNEWLEILYDYGAFVLFLYLCLWIYLVKRWFFHYRTNSKYLIAYTLSLSILSVMSMVSQLVLYVSYFLYLVMFWAIVEALSETDYYEYRMSRVKA